ncbi:hypothetical protein VTO42DRAFT_7997 [Malbranchea cinnamomea]
MMAKKKKFDTMRHVIVAVAATALACLGPISTTLLGGALFANDALGSRAPDADLGPVVDSAADGAISSILRPAAGASVAASSDDSAASTVAQTVDEETLSSAVADDDDAGAPDTNGTVVRRANAQREFDVVFNWINALLILCGFMAFVISGRIL